MLVIWSIFKKIYDNYLTICIRQINTQKTVVYIVCMCSILVVYIVYIET